MAADRTVVLRRLWPIFYALALVGCRAGTVLPPPAYDPLMWAADCHAMYQQELGRDADPEGLVGCEHQMAAAQRNGAPIPQEVFRAWLRQQPEWAQHQEAIRVVILPKLVVNGQFFTLESGAPFYVIETSDFNLYGRFLSGEDIEPILEQRRGAGFNSLRVFTRYDIDPRFGIGRLRLDEHPELYVRLPAFLRTLAKVGLYADLVAYTGPYTEGLDLTHWAHLCQAVQGSTNVIVSLVNENDQAANHIDTSLFAPCPNVLSSRGSAGGGMWPESPVWDWTEYHSNGQSEWQRKTGHEAFEMASTWQKPAHATENTRYPDNESSVTRAFGAAAASALLNAGATFHAVHGKNSQLFEGVELEAAKAWADGAWSIPLSCQRQPYVHGQREINEETAGGWLRVYRRGTDPACVARVPR